MATHRDMTPDRHLFLKPLPNSFPPFRRQLLPLSQHATATPRSPTRTPLKTFYLADWDHSGVLDFEEFCRMHGASGAERYLSKQAKGLYLGSVHVDIKYAPSSTLTRVKRTAHVGIRIRLHIREVRTAVPALSHLLREALPRRIMTLSFLLLCTLCVVRTSHCLHHPEASSGQSSAPLTQTTMALSTVKSTSPSWDLRLLVHLAPQRSG